MVFATVYFNYPKLCVGKITSTCEIHTNIDDMKKLTKLSDYNDQNPVFLFEILPLSLCVLCYLTFLKYVISWSV